MRSHAQEVVRQMRRFVFLALAVVVAAPMALVLPSCSTDPIYERPFEGEVQTLALSNTGYVMRVSDKSDKQELTLAANQAAAIELPCNVSSGFRWQVGSLDESLLQVLGSEIIEEGGKLLGAPCRQVFYVSGLGSGRAEIQFDYLRPFRPHRVVQTERFSFRLEGRPTIQFEMPVREKMTPVADLSDNRLAALPPRLNWCENSGCTPVKDQGQCGSCWAFSTVGALENVLKLRNGVTADLSEQYLVSCNDEGWGCDGGYFAHDYHLSQMVSGENEAGAVLEDDFPYEAIDASCNPPHVKAHKLESWSYIAGESEIPSVSQIKEAIFKFGPVSAAMCANTDEFAAYSGGVYDADCSDLDHAIVLTGWDDSEGVWYLRNSWGPEWGEEGNMRIKYGVGMVGYGASYVEVGGAVLNAAFGFTSEGLQASFTDASTPPAGGSIQGWSWDFGDGHDSHEQNPQHTYASAGSYTVTLTVTDDSDQKTSAARVITVPKPIDICESTSLDSSEEWIAQVEIGNFSNASDGQEYSDFTDQIINLVPGEYEVSLTPNFDGGPWTEYFRIWIDLDGDGDFEDPEEAVFEEEGEDMVSGTLVIPSQTSPGLKRMRVSMSEDGDPSPCGDFVYGEVEDYTVQIMEAPASGSLFFSEYLEGTMSNKALEIYNGGGEALPLRGCEVQEFVNGDNNVTHSIPLDDVTLEPGAVFVLCSRYASQEILALCDQQSSDLSYNGNDAVALVCHNDVLDSTLDVIGVIGQVPGQAWGHAPITTADHTLVRKCFVAQGDTDSSDDYDPADEWDSFTKDDSGHIGSHQTGCK